MSPERWQRAGEVFHAVLEEAPNTPSDLVERLCDGDHELAATVLDLLRAHHDAPTFIDRPAFEVLGQPADPLPERIGSYRIVRPLGRGGMGAVYLAERDDGTFEKEVALKVLSRELAFPDFQERFHRERQILARLEHPSITRLLDGGTTTDGRPYLVVELVDGLPLDRYVAEVRPGLEARLDLFVDVCSAVQAAHQQLVVHRDLKPGNILVTDEGRPKLLDFGIAKLLSPELAATATGPSDRLLTPPYASPEQIRGEPVGTAADVFGLGVLLYELLAERHPFEEERRDPVRLARAIVERDPAPPSIAAASVPDDLAPRRWSARLRGDLDRIVHKALHKDPARRYSSAEALARDVERHRKGLPVEARGDSLGYLTASFLRRHRLAAGATAAVFALLVAATVGLWLQRSQILRERDHAEAVSDYLVEIFDSADPGTARGRDITAGELLDRARRRIARTDLAPATRAAFLQSIGEAYAGLGEYGSAAEILSESIAIRRESGAGAEDLADVVSALGGVLLAMAELDRAHAALQETVALLESSLGEAHPDTALALSELAVSHQRVGRLEEAEASFREALRHLESADDPVARAHVRHRLAALLRERDQLDSALELLRLGLADLVSVRGARPDPDVAIFERDVGTILRRQGRLDDARQRYREALAMQRVLFPDGHPDIAVTLSLTASVAQRQGSYDEAEKLFAEVVEMRQRLLGDGHPLVGNALLNQANLAVDRDDLPRAADLYRNAIAIQEAALPDDDRDLASSRTGLATVLSRLGEHAQAEALHRQVLQATLDRYGERHSRAAFVRNNLARSLQDQERLEEAREQLQIAVDVLTETMGPDHLHLATAWNNLADVLRLAGDLESAAEAFERAFGIAQGQLGRENPTTLQIAVNRMAVLLRRAPDPDTRRNAKELKSVVDRVLGPDHRSARQLQGLLEDATPPLPLGANPD